MRKAKSQKREANHKEVFENRIVHTTQAKRKCNKWNKM